MYFLKFIKWWWVDHLDSFDRSMALLCLWMGLMFASIIIGVFTKCVLIIIAPFAVSLMIAGIFLIINLVKYIRNLYYDEFQGEVINKLKGKE